MIIGKVDIDIDDYSGWSMRLEATESKGRNSGRVAIYPLYSTLTQACMYFINKIIFGISHYVVVIL